jgi:lysophospholipase L1-like esterase
MNSKSNRRNFIRNASIGAAVSTLFPQIVSAAFEAEQVKKIIFEKNDVVLFQGDSITDWGRAYDNRVPNTSNTLGAGFVLPLAGGLLLDFPDKNLQIYNKGIAGNKVFQLADRWETDCIAIKPNVLSILVGVNDFSHTLFYDYKGTVETYLNDYRQLLKWTKKALPNVKLVIGEPFVVRTGKLVTDKWFPAFDAYRKAARDIAIEFNAPFIPFQAVFDKALTLAPAGYWSIDGIHPTVAGAALMARAWREIVS